MAAITVTNLSKRYRAYSSPFDRLKDALGGSSGSAREFTALEDVSFEVPRGSALGVVGPNGAGKSTLLKILAGIVEPTSGEVHMQGKIASIIELGAGFHPDFTGRENVFLNAALLGFSDAETRGKYDEIASFCELGRYMDMPVKTYSSGMFVRLAFAVAISAEPDILLVDEALAVGDAVFAHRCLSKIRDMRDRGVTIVFVSHDTNTIAGVCDRAIFINRGHLVADGPPKDVIHLYLLNVAERLTTLNEKGSQAARFHEVGAVESTRESNEKRFGSFQARITDIAIENAAGQQLEKIVSGEDARFRITVRFDRAVRDPVFGIMFKNRFGAEVFGTNTYLRKMATGSFTPGDVVEVRFSVPMHLGKGVYTASFAIHTADGHYFDYRVDARVFEVVGALDTIGVINLPVDISIGEASADARTDDGLLERIYAGAPSVLTMGEDAERYLRGDWYAVQSADDVTYRWIGKRAEAFIKLPERCREIWIRVRSVHPDPQVERALEIRVDGAPAGRYVFRTGEWADAALEVPTDKCGKVVAMGLRPSSTWVPRDFDPASSDDRELGVMVAEIRAR